MNKSRKNTVALITLIMILFLTASTAHAEYVPNTYTAQTQPPADDYKKGELIVKFKDTVNIDENQIDIGYAVSTAELKTLNTLNKQKAKSMKKLFREKSSPKDKLSNIYIIHTDKDEDIIKLAEKYKNNPYVEYAEPNYEVHALEIPDDTNYSSQWSHQIANSEDAWDIETGNKSIIIAIVDTGIDFDHPELDSKTWNNTAEIPGNNIDDDGNGYIDDVKGWDFINNDNYPDDDHFHGSHCSGIAAAETNNSQGVAGVCWNCTVMPVKCLSSSGSGTWTSVSLSVRYAADNGADIISLSLGGSSYSSVLEDAVDYAHNKGVVVIAAAGNTGSKNFGYPAAYRNVISVTATTDTDQKASFSTYGYWTDIAAPGVDIYSTMIDSYAYKSGTSMSCPFVAGVAGLLLSNNSNLTNDMIETILKSSTDPVTTTVYMGTGRINVKEALEKADSEIIAMIDSPFNGMISSGIVSITGTVQGAVNYSLYYAEGIYPDSWTMISSSTTPITDSELGQLNTYSLENGIYTIKLQATDNKNNTFIDYTHVTLDNQPLGITVNSPLNTTYFSPIIQFDITSEFGAVSCSYSVDGQPGIALDSGNPDYYGWTNTNTDLAKGQHNVIFTCKNKYDDENSTEAVWFNISANIITGCSILDQADAIYYLISDIENNSAAGACINITAPNITLYCQDHLIDGISSTNTYGIYTGENNTNISKCRISDWNYGIYLKSSSGSTITGNKIEKNQQYGMYLNSTENSIIYNNLFNNTDNIGLTTYHPNTWNTTIAEGDRIYSLGDYIGGNYYTNPTGTGYSDTCTDTDNDGFCDESYTLNSENTDHLPLSDKCLYQTIDSCQSLDIVDMTYQLKSDISSESTCFTLDADGITLDCNSHTFEGTSTGYGIYAYVNEKDLKNITIRNCAIDNFHMGIYASKNHYSTHSMENFYLDNLSISDNYYGMYIRGPIYSSAIKNTTVYGSDFYGVYLNNFNDGLIADNTVYSNYNTGLYIYDSDNNEITGNTAFANGGSGISVSTSYNNTMRNNTMTENTYDFSVSGKTALNSYHYIHDIDTSNTVDGRPVYYWVNKQDMEVPTDAGFVGVIDSDNITVKDLNLSGNNPGLLFINTNNSRIENVNASYNSFNGIYMTHSDNNTVVKNDIASNYYYGLYMYDSANNTVAGNNIDDINYGLYMHGSDNNTVEDNTIDSNSYSLYMYTSDNNAVAGNNVDEGNYGLYMYSSVNNTVEGNTLGSIHYGLYMYLSANNTVAVNTIDGINYGFYMYTSDNNTVAGNTIGESTYGLYMSYSKDNSIYDNYIDNTKKPTIYGTYTNAWNTSETSGTNIIGDPYIGGNYWANSAGTGYSQTCADADNDGFCDVPYVINSYNTDYLPLSNKYMQTYSITMSLYKQPDSTGLNLITLPLNNSFTTAEDLCNNITYADEITMWDPIAQQYRGHPCATPFNNFTLNNGEGYFVSVTQNTTWTLTGKEQTLPPITLLKIDNDTGLNLIGLPYSSTVTPFTAEGLCSNITYADEITMWDPMAQQYKGHPCTTPFNNFTLNNGEGYFVSVTQNTTWVPN